MPGPSCRYVAQSVPVRDAQSSNQELSCPAGIRRSTGRKLYSTAPESHSLLVCVTRNS
jgi:hypothetical protein